MNQKKLSLVMRKKIIEFITPHLVETMFGDGLEYEYIENGVQFIGVKNMSDDELLIELDQFVDHEDSSAVETKLYEQARCELRP